MKDDVNKICISHQPICSLERFVVLGVTKNLVILILIRFKNDILLGTKVLHKEIINYSGVHLYLAINLCLEVMMMVIKMSLLSVFTYNQNRGEIAQMVQQLLCIRWTRVQIQSFPCCSMPYGCLFPQTHPTNNDLRFGVDNICFRILV